MKRTSRRQEAFTDCLWHGHEGAILLEWLLEALKNKLAEANAAANSKATLALTAELITVREHLKRAFRALTHIKPRQLTRALSLESCSTDAVTRERLDRLERLTTK